MVLTHRTQSGIQDLTFDLFNTEFYIFLAWGDLYESKHLFDYGSLKVTLRRLFHTKLPGGGSLPLAAVYFRDYFIMFICN